MVVVAVVSFLIDVSPELMMKDKRIYEKHKKEGPADGGESQPGTQDVSVTCNYSFDFLCVQFYLFVICFIYSQSSRLGSGLLACL